MLTQFFDPIVGGEERAVEDLATELAARGHGVAIATLHVDGTPAREEVQGVRVHRLEGLVNSDNGPVASARREIIRC